MPNPCVGVKQNQRTASDAESASVPLRAPGICAATSFQTLSLFSNKKADHLKVTGFSNARERT